MKEQLSNNRFHLPRRSGLVTLDQTGPMSSVPENSNGGSQERSTHAAKQVYTENGENGSKETEPLTYISFMRKFPDIRETEGTLGKEGIVAYNRNGEVIGAVRSWDWIPKGYTPYNNYLKVTFGGEQNHDHIERSALREAGPKKAARIAQEIIDAAKKSVDLPRGSAMRGSEVESYRIIRDSGEIAAAPENRQEELICGMVETALDATDTVEKGMMLRAQHVIKQAQDPDVFYLNTGVPLVGSVNDSGMDINYGDYKKYVAVVSAHLKPRIGRFDSYGSQVADHIARKKGYENLEHMRDDTDHMAYWFNAAGHHSVGLPYDENGKVSTEIAIAAADIAASDMGKIAELLMYSSPLILGERPPIQTPDGEKYPLDYRDLYRHLMQTTFPGDLIKDSKTLQERMKKGIVSGEVHTMDRTAFRMTLTDGQSFPSYHGPVRLRGADSGKPDARIESTGPGSSFSLLDEYARDVLLDVFNLAAYEAVAHGKHPSEHFGERYPSLTDSANRMDIGRAYNLNGPQDPFAGAAIDECVKFMEEMADKYPPFRKNIAIAKKRIENLTQQATASNFEEYAQNPVGPVSQVMQNMLNNDVKPLEIAKAANAYELKTAHALLETKGDAEPLVGRAA